MEAKKYAPTEAQGAYNNDSHSHYSTTDYLLNNKPYQRHIAQFEDLPPELTERPIWCAWKLVQKPNKAKPDKVPVSPKDGRQDGWTLPEFCTTAEQAIHYAEAHKNMQGIGIVLHEESALAGGDLDGCIHPDTGELSEEAASIIARADTYTEVSPGLKGVRFIAEGSFGGYTGNNHEKGVEFYQKARMLTITGFHIEETPFSIEQRDLTELGKEFHQKKDKASDNQEKPEPSESADFNDLELEPRIREYILKGPGPKQDRSNILFGVAKDLLRAGAEPARVLAILSDRGHAISEAAYDRRNDKQSAQDWIWKYCIVNAIKEVEAEPSFDDEQHRSREWPTPVDLFAEHPVPPFPNAILPKAFQNLANEKSAQSGFDPGAYGFSLFVAASNTIDHRAKLDLGPFRVPAYQWGGLVGDSGTAKSPILNDSKQSAENIDKALLDESRRALSRWMDACQRAKEDKAEMPPKPPWKQRNALDTTTEALGLLLTDNPEGVNMYHHEITEFIGRMDAYSGKDGGKDRGVYLRSYDGGYVTINRANNRPPMVIDNFSVGILAGIQPEKLAYLFKQSGGGSDGLYQRFMMYCLQPAGEVDYMAKENPFTQNNVDMIFERIHNWIGNTNVSASLSSPAKKLMQDYHNTIRKLATRTAAQRFAEHLNKFPGMLGRAAFALHCINAAAKGEEPGKIVESDTMSQAIVLMRVMYRHSEAVYTILDQAAGDVRGLFVSAAEAILSKAWSTFKRGDLTRHATHWQGSDSRQTEAAIDYLIELGWIADITPPALPGKRGRRSDGVYAVNPDVHHRYKAHTERITAARAERYKAIQAAAG